jgi:hypothetical protein
MFCLTIGHRDARAIIRRLATDINDHKFYKTVKLCERLRRTSILVRVLEGNTEADYQDDLLEDIERLAITLHDNLSSVLPPYYINLYGSSQNMTSSDFHTIKRCPLDKKTTIYLPIQVQERHGVLDHRCDEVFQDESSRYVHSQGVIRLPDWHHTHDGVHLADFYVTRRKRGFGLVDRDVHWTRQQGQRGDGIRLQLQDSRRHSRSDSVRDVYIFDFESSSMWMILIRLKMMLIIITSQSADSVPIGTYLDFDMSQCRTDFKHTADNLSSSFRAFYASVNGINLFQKP